MTGEAGLRKGVLAKVRALAVARALVVARSLATARGALALLALAVLAFGPFATAQDASSAQSVQIGSRAFDISRNLRCPVCTSESVADSSAEIAQQMRALIQEKIDEGLSDAQIYTFFQERYGDWILLDPPKRGVHLLVWLLPVVVGAAAVVVVISMARRWLAASAKTEDVSQADLERVRAALAGAAKVDDAATDAESDKGG